MMLFSALPANGGNKQEGGFGTGGSDALIGGLMNFRLVPFPSVQLQPLGSAVVVSISCFFLPKCIVSKGKETLISAQRGLTAARGGPRVPIWIHIH